MKTYVVLYRTIAPGNIETDCSYKGQASSEELFRQSFAVMCAIRHSGLEIRIQAVSEI